MTTRIELLDHGYIELLPRGCWGDDAFIIESARMSTDKGFLGWGPKACCSSCGSERVTRDPDSDHPGVGTCAECGHGYITDKPGDEKLLKFLWTHKHSTPFEFCGATFEIQAPIAVFREWHRHRTMWYSELSARYVAMPDLNYMPTRERFLDGAKATSNRQAQGMVPLVPEAVEDWSRALKHAYGALQETYEVGLSIGIPKELARLCVPVGRYSRMRAGANLRNWLHFLTLRMAPNAQWEIRQYANAAHAMLSELFPRTLALFDEGMK